MKGRPFKCFCAALLLVSWSAKTTIASGQTMTPTTITDSNRMGKLPFSTTIGTTVEHVDLASGALNVDIPLFSVPGRGLSTGASLHYSSNIYNVAILYDGEGDITTQEWAAQVGSGWSDNSPAYTTSYIQVTCLAQGRNGAPNVASYISQFLYTDTSHVQHALASQSGGGTAPCQNPGDAGPDTGAAGMWSPAVSQVLDPSGTGFVTSTSVETDANGNYVTLPAFPFGGCTDTFGRSACSGSSTRNPDGSFATVTYNLYDSTGTQRSYVLHWIEVPISTSFGTGPQEDNSTTYQPAPTLNVISEIDLPNGQKYTFSYESGYGLLNQITLPDGGTVQYVYSNYTDTSDIYNTGTRRYVSARTETIGGTSSTWNISIPNNQGNNVSAKTSTVTFPDAAHHQAVVTAQNGAVSDMKVYAGSVGGTPLREYQVQYASDANPLRDTCYSEWGQGEIPQAQAVGVRPTQITTILENGLASVKAFTYDSFSYAIHSSHCNTAKAATNYTTSRGDILEEDDYDWAQSDTLGTLLRKITHTYLHTTASNASAYVAANIVDKIASTSVYNGAGTLLAQTNYTYDDYSSGDGGGLTATSSVPAHDYTAHSTSDTLRGNLTQSSKWLNSGSGSWLTTAYGYDDLGNILSEKDPLGHTTTWSFLDSWANTACPPSGNSHAYPTSTTVASGTSIAETTQVLYYPCTGLKEAVKGPNDLAQGRNGTVWTYDSVGRQSSVTFPDGGNQTLAYSDYNPSTNPSPSTTTTVTAISASPALSLTSIVERDGLGRPRKTTTYTNSSKKIYSRTSYDAMHRAAQQWNPTYCDPDTNTSCSADAGTFGSTVTQYDALDRETLSIPPDGTSSANHVSTTYSANNTTTTDETGAVRTSTVDGLGRLTQVSEGSAGYITAYPYDGLGNLLCAEQHGGVGGTGCSSSPSSDATSPWRVRRFTYDSLSRLLTSKNPETGQTPISYSYDADGDLLTKTNTRGITISYSPSGSPIDALNRVTQTTYSDGTPTVTFSYDAGTNGIGHRTGMVDGSGSSTWSYDPMGRESSEQRTIGSGPGVTKTVGTLYNLDGSARQITYPSGNVVTITPGDHGLPASVTDASHSYALGVGYGPTGLLTGATYGQTGGFNGIVQSNSYNSRLQPAVLSAATSAATLMSLMYDFGLGTNDNGNVYHIWNEKVANHSRDQAFTYDGLNRISTARNATWGVQVNLDAWGNVAGTTGISGTSLVNPMPLPSDLGANGSNQPTSSQIAYTFSGGNLTSDGSHSYSYDAEDRIITVGSTAYTYDGEGNRVKKSTGTLYWGQGLAESDTSGNITSEYVFLNGKRVARRDPATGNVYYFLSDHLGSSNVVTDANGKIQNESDFYPYGGENSLSNNLSNHYKFTGKERDAESGLDYFGARYYSSVIGRFSSPDSVSGDPMNPQSWNLYSYVQNNPLSRIDPDGHDCVVQTRTSNTTENVSTSSGNCDNVSVGDGQTKTYVPGTVTGISVNGGNSIDIGYNSYDGQSSGVTNSGAAPVPENTNLAYGWGNNAQGYQQLAGAANVVNKAAAVTVGVYGGVACYIACPAATAAAARWGLQRLAMGASSPALLNLINRLYQAQDEIPGGTAGAVRNEVMTGEYINGGHSIKASEMVTALTKLINSGQLNGSDQTIAGHIISDLNNSLGR